MKVIGTAKGVAAPAPTVVDALVVLRVDAGAQLRPRARLHGCKRGRVCAEAHQGRLCLKLHLQHKIAEHTTDRHLVCLCLQAEEADHSVKVCGPRWYILDLNTSAYESAR